MKKLLMVDDSKTARMMAKHWIAAQFPEIKVFEAQNGEEALAWAEQETEPFLAVLDYNMPGMAGLELAEKLQNLFPGLKMALVTANIQDTIRERAKSMGVFFVPKPLNPPKIKMLIAELER